LEQKLNCTASRMLAGRRGESASPDVVYRDCHRRVSWLPSLSLGLGDFTRHEQEALFHFSAVRLSEPVVLCLYSGFRTRTLGGGIVEVGRSKRSARP
jgi:hypothetical protein